MVELERVLMDEGTRKFAEPQKHLLGRIATARRGRKTNSYQDFTPMIQLKRAYEKPSRDDGSRILVERLWPRGLTKEKAALELWLGCLPARSCASGSATIRQSGSSLNSELEGAWWPKGGGRLLAQPNQARHGYLGIRRTRPATQRALA